jgi:chromosome segregation and condensation protein ScpB
MPVKSRTRGCRRPLQQPSEPFARKLSYILIDRLYEISVKEIQDALDNVEGNKPTQRLLAAIAYKSGVTQTELAE